MPDGRSRLGPVIGLVLMLVVALGVVAWRMLEGEDTPTDPPPASETSTATPETPATPADTPLPKISSVVRVVDEAGTQVLVLRPGTSPRDIGRAAGQVRAWADRRDMSRTRMPVLGLGPARLSIDTPSGLVQLRLFANLGKWRLPGLRRVELASVNGAIEVTMGTRDRRLVERAVPVVQKLTELPRKQREALDIVTLVRAEGGLQRIVLAEGAIGSPRTAEVLDAVVGLAQFNPAVTLTRQDTAQVALYLGPNASIVPVWRRVQEELGGLSETGVEVRIGDAVWIGSPRGEPRQREAS